MKQVPYWGPTILEGAVSLNFIYKLEHILVYMERKEAAIIMLKTFGNSVQKTKSLNKSFIRTKVTIIEDTVRFLPLNSFHHHLQGSQGGSHSFTFVSKVISLDYLPPIFNPMSLSLTHILIPDFPSSKQASPSKFSVHFRLIHPKHLIVEC